MTGSKFKYSTKSGEGARAEYTSVHTNKKIKMVVVRTKQKPGKKLLYLTFDPLLKKEGKKRVQ